MRNGSGLITWLSLMIIWNTIPLFFWRLTGDEILSVNGQSVDGKTHDEVLALFKKVKVGTICVEFIRQPKTDRYEDIKRKQTWIHKDKHTQLQVRDSDDLLICLFMTNILFCLIYFFLGLKRNEVQAFNPVLNWISSNETTKSSFILTNHLFYLILVKIIFIAIVRINKERNRDVN